LLCRHRGLLHLPGRLGSLLRKILELGLFRFDRRIFGDLLQRRRERIRPCGKLPFAHGRPGTVRGSHLLVPARLLALQVF
jgi:hypothetical protein